MRSPILSLTIAGCLLAVAASAHETPEEIESLAKLVCKTTKGTKRQISHVHDISQLVHFFQAIPADSKLLPCRNLYLESLEDLERVVTTANEDACGEQKIKLLEDFHRKYVSKVSKYVRQQKRSNKAPKMAKLFFMQYANKISSICEENAASFLEKHQHHVADDEMARLKELRKFTDTLGMSDFSDGYKGIYLFWNMIDSLGPKLDKKFSKYLSPSGQVRINIQMKDGSSLRWLKALCQFKLRPAYSQSILPVLRLVDMGYYPQSEQILSEEPKVRSMFLATHICETLMPVRVFDEEKLGNDQFVALTVDEAAELVPNKEIEGWAYEEVEAPKRSVVGLDALISADPAEAQASLESVKANVVARSKVVTRMMNNCLKLVGESAKKWSKTLFKRGANKQLEPVGEDELNREQAIQLPVDVVVADDDADDEVASAGGGRMKRSWRDWGISAMFIIWCFYIIILTIVKLGILGIPTIIALVTNYPSYDRKILWLWKLAWDPTAPIPNGFLDYRPSVDDD